MESTVEMDSWQIYRISFSMLSLQYCMMADDRFLELTSLEQRISNALQAVLLEFILHLQAVENSFIYYYCIASFSFLFILMISRTYFTMSSYRQVCSAILAKFMIYQIYRFILLLFQMHCHCHRRSSYQEKFARQEETIALLEELIQKEKQAHLEEIRAINQNLEEYSRENDKKIAEYEDTVLKLGKKLDHYKSKNTNQNEKLKENSNSIKSLMEKKLSLQAEILRLRETVEMQRERGLQSTRYISEMKQIVSLQEIENKELHREVERLKQEICYLQREIANYGEVRDKFSNIEEISQEQYHKQISLLKNSLENQFCKKTNDIFKDMTAKNILEERDLNTQTLHEYAKINIESEQLKKLAHFIDYGESYFELENNQLQLFQSKKIFKFIASILKELRSTEQALSKQQEINIQLANDWRQKLAYYDAQIREISQKQTHNKQTQTNESTKITQVINTNTSLKVKIYEVTKIIQFLSQFSMHLFNVLSLQSTKTRYFHFTEACFFKKQGPRRSKLRSVCYSILFVQILKKGAHKYKRISPDQKLDKPNLSKYMKSQYLANLLYSFSLKQKRKISIKNHKIQELINDKSQLNPHQKIVQILNQQNLNQGLNPFDYSQIFNRFIFHSQKSFPRAQ